MAKKREPANKIPKDVMDKRVDEVCERVVEGETIREIARAMGVSAGLIMKWVGSDPLYSERYARARDAAADLFEADIIERARNITDPAAARVEIDALKWVAARRAPVKYGDRVNTDVTSSDGSMRPSVIEIVAVAAKPKAKSKK